MNKRIFIILFALICMVLTGPAEARTWYVDDSGGVDFTSIRDAINSASSGDTIYVYNGTYSGFYVNKPYLTIIGEGNDLVTVTPNDVGQYNEIRLPYGTGDNATGTVLEGMNISIQLPYFGTFGTASDVIIKNCIFNRVFSRIYMEGDKYTFENNIVSNASSSQSIGIDATGASYIIRNNYFNNNYNSYGHLYIRSACTGSIIDGNIFSNSGTTRNLVLSASECIVSNNTFINNTGIGIRISNNNNTITRNTFIKNNEAIQISSGENNRIYLNTFNDTQEITYKTVPSITYWSSPDQITYTYNGTTYASYMGNYWPNYNGTDTNGDGIGDDPYVLPDSLGTDNYPLMQSYENYNFVGSGPVALVAAFTASPTSGDAPLTVQFTDESTGSPTSWAWDFENDGIIDSTNQNPSFTYTSAGNYTVNLTVANADGSDSEVKTDCIVVNEPLPEPPVADFTATPTSGDAPLMVNFTDSSNGTVSSYAWDFDNDGNVDSEEENPSYTYETVGTYTVNLTVANADGSDSEVKTNYITVTQAGQVATNDLSIAAVLISPSNVVFAREANNIEVYGITNSGTETLTNITVALYASDVSDTVPVSTATISSLAGGGTTTKFITDPTIRDLQGSTVTYTAVVDPDNLIPETNEANNNKSRAGPVKYNGYKGKGLYWEGGSNITTRHTFDLQGNLLCSTMPTTAYKSVGTWGSGRTETWTASDLPVPSGSTIEKVFLYFAYNWDQTAGGYPWLNLSFNGNIIENGNLSTGNGTLYRDWSNFGAYADYEYGLCVYDVTDRFSSSGNSFVTNPYDGDNNLYGKVALYPSTLVVVYKNSNETRKQIFINEECDELGVSASSYGTTLEEATAYAPFTGMSIETVKVQNATLYSFAGSAGPDEGNLLFNGNIVATNAWQGDSKTSNAQVFDVKSYLNETGNEAGIQGTTSGGMDALQQILVVEYPKETVAGPIANFSANVTEGDAPLTVNFTDTSTGSPTSWFWDFGDGANVSEQNPSHTYSAEGIYTVNLTVENAAGSDFESKSSYIEVSEASGSTVTLYFDPESSSVAENESTEINLVTSNFPAGLSGYNLTVTLDDPNVAEIVDIEYPSWALITENSTLPGTSIYLKTVDGNDTVKADAENVVLAILTVSGKEKGSANLSIGVDRMDDDSGNAIEPTCLTGKIEVPLLSPLPDQEYAPKDLDGDGLYEDLTGNGEFSFVDIVAYFHNMDWIEENMPVEYFDFNVNGRIDFDDVVDMFAMI
ncbi:cell surface protein [Methanosarcina siciliae HI350]|uniref:Cell surface protein n=1 Tax=Methanosarcina siciliae HI350 TaxID=1434119 RepID=A0A0E3LB15_9EURY|nr:DUF3344 domain-containing protein [Methanosarcina siciliae]AKB32981.1 cell surface protein [Methanosarcina siciliae HI350]